MTIEEFLKSTPDDIRNKVSKVEYTNDLVNEIVSLEGEANELERQLSIVKNEIDVWLEDFNSGVTKNLVERAIGLKKAYEEKIVGLKDKKKELEEKRKEYEKITNNINRQQQKERIKKTVRNSFNRIKINKGQAFAMSSDEIMKRAAIIGSRIAVKSTDKFKNVVSKIKDKTVGAKEWVKEDLKKGVGYKTATIIKENAPVIASKVKETTEKAKITIDKSKCAIAKAPKKTINNIKSSFSKVAVNLNGVKKVVAKKGITLFNNVKESVKNEIDYIKEAYDINQQKKEQFENYKKQLEEEVRLMKEQVRKKTGKSL
ncbi:MAG: hypothetical protein J6O56_00045 [Bacilli bacterium]|nr:hypothetical protein [Bacilli bacterium]